MNKQHVMIASIGLAILFNTVVLRETPCSAAESKAAPETAVKAAIYSAAETENFQMLAKATLKALNEGKSETMVAKLTDLETTWDEKEETLKPKDEVTWTLLDKTLDKAISALRSSKTNLPKGKIALEDLIKKLEQATKPKTP